MEDQRNIHYRTGGKLTHCGVECLPEGKDIERIIIARIEYKESCLGSAFCAEPLYLLADVTQCDQPEKACEAVPRV